MPAACVGTCRVGVTGSRRGVVALLSRGDGSVVQAAHLAVDRTSESSALMWR